jgi:uncharacterized protein (TIGR03000 family)
MLRRWIPSLATFALVVIGLLVFTETAEAQRRFRDRRMNRRGYYNPPVYYSQPMQGQPIPGQPMQGYSTQSYPGPGQSVQGQPMPPGTTPGTPGAPGSERRAFYGANVSAPAQLSVRLPAMAELQIDGQKTRSTGPMRRYTSPPLEPGQQYTYELRAKWMQNGREMTRTRTVEVRPGQVVNVDLLSPSAEERPTPDSTPAPDNKTIPDSKTIP